MSRYIEAGGFVSGHMSGYSRMLLLVLGLLIWGVGTVYYAYVGARVLETTAARYWISFVA
jgi:hypothetical protein